MNDNINGVQNPNMAPAPVAGIPEMPAAGMQPMAPAAPMQPMAPAAPAAPMAPAAAAPVAGIPEMPATPMMQQPMAPAAPVMQQPMAAPAAPVMQQPMAAPAAPVMQQPMAAPGGPVMQQPMGAPGAPVMPAAPAMPPMPGALPNPNAPADNKPKEKKGPPKKIIIGVAVLAIGLLFFLVVLPYINNMGEDSGIDEAKGSTFVSDAKKYMKHVEDNFTTYASGLACGANTNSVILSLADLQNVEGGIAESPFGGSINKESSFVEVDAVPNNGSCEYVYYIYMTDGNYSIGTEGSPVKESDLSVESIIKN